MLSELAPWLFLVVVVVVAAIVFLFVIRRRRPKVQEDRYTQGLEKWLAGDLSGAQGSFRAAIATDPHAVDPYLQLGNLLRLQGDAKRAVILHRGLTVRTDLPPSKKLSISLALVDDLIQLKRWDEAKQALDSIEAVAGGSPRFWRARFEQRLGVGDESGAAKALRAAAQRCPEPIAEEFGRQHTLFLLDRSLRLVESEKPEEARRLLKEMPRDSAYAARQTFVRALAAVADGDAESAISLATEGLVESPQEMALFFPTLQHVLLGSGRYERAVPILERACQAEQAPPALWLALALLYEKLEQREKAIMLFEGKAGDPGLTCEVAAPFLKLLAAEESDSPFGRIWRTLHLPAVAVEWSCGRCGDAAADVRWFCPACHAFDSYSTSTLR